MPTENLVRESNLPITEYVGDNFCFRAVTDFGEEGVSVNIPKDLALEAMNPLKEDKSNKKTDIESNKTSDIFYPTIKAIYDWIIGLFVPKTRTITINGTEQDLSADRSYEVVADVLVDNIYVEKNTEGEITLSQKTLKRINAGI